MTIVNVGVSHRIAPAEMLEKLAVPAAELGGVLARLHAVPGIDEVVVLSTCNRVEVYAAASGPAKEVIRAVADVMAAGGSAKADEVRRLARTRVGGAAAEHLFSVACGLDSMAVGEDQIVAQIKDAARAARAAGTTGPVISGLIDAALRTSKRARTQTTISTEGISPARAGLDLAAGHLGGLAARPAGVLRTGVTLVDLSALGGHLASLDVPGQIPQVRAIVAAEAAAYMDRRDQAAAAPVIAAMHEQIRRLADAELARLHDRLPELSEQQRAETTATVHRILRKVLHRPTVRAKEFSAGPQGPLYLEALRQLFDLSTSGART